MERSASMEFVRWEEVYVSRDKGRREIHYYLKRRDGTKDLAIVGKETSLRHMSYRYAIRNRSIAAIAPSSSRFKLRYRREVVDWLNSVVSDTTPHKPSFELTYPLDSTDSCKLNTNKLKDSQLRKLGHYTKEFLWLGSAWTCRKRRKHYGSFCRNGVKISVHDFIFVLAEEDKRLVAYVEDMYEDSKGNKMVVVRWFHKSDEVGIVLPHIFNDREIFFSLCLQDLNIECIDGLATVLNPQHFEKFSNKATCTQFEPFVCSWKYENDDVTPFDISLVKGYWKQEILRYVTSTSNASVKPLPIDDDLSLQNAGKRKSSDAAYAGGSEKLGLKNTCFPAPLASSDPIKEDPLQYLTVGMQIEVLSQDSGLRGCWFRATIIKKHKNFVKVRYRDLPDAEDEAKSLEEWLVASRVAVPDKLGLRLWGRKTIRPSSQPNKSKVSWMIDVGSIVDVWWHDGWWEGIVIQKESDFKFHVYFAGENRKLTFDRGVLRHSQEWLGNSWEHVRERPDVVNSLSSGLEESNQVVDEQADYKLAQDAVPVPGKVTRNIQEDNFFGEGVDGFDGSLLEVAADDRSGKLAVVPDLLKDVSLARLKWNTAKKRSLAELKWDSSKKRKRGSGSSIQQPDDGVKNGARKPEVVGSRLYEGFFIPSSLNVDHDNCKSMGDSLFSSSVVPPLTSLVMSR